MAYKYTVKVKTTPEPTLVQIETELEEFFKIKAKVEEILQWSIEVPMKIKKEVLDILGLPSNINVSYEIAHDFSYAVPMVCDEIDFQIS